MRARNRCVSILPPATPSHLLLPTPPHQYTIGYTCYLRPPLQESLVDFENILAMEPRNYVGDNFSRVTPIYKVTQYNIACCYAMLDQVGGGWAWMLSGKAFFTGEGFASGVARVHGSHAWG